MDVQVKLETKVSKTDIRFGKVSPVLSAEQDATDGFLFDGERIDNLHKFYPLREKLNGTFKF